MDIDDVVQGRVAARFFPDIARQHLAGDNVALMTHQVLKKLELARGQVQRLAAARNGTADHVHFEIPDSQSRAGLGDSSAAERPDASEQLGKRKGFYEIIVGAGIQAADTIFDGISRRQHQDRRFESVLPHGGQNLKAAPAWKHDVEDDQIEGFRFNQVEAFFAGMGQRNAVLFGLQALPQCLAEFLFVFDHQNPQRIFLLLYRRADDPRPLTTS